MKVRWAKGGEAEIVAITIDTVALLSTIPSPPGSRIEGTLLGLAPIAGAGAGAGQAASGVTVRVKVHGCKREADGRYRIDGRPLDLTRQLLDRLQAHV